MTKPLILEKLRSEISSGRPEKRARSPRQHPEQDLQIAVVSKILEPLEMAGKLSFAAFSNGFKRSKAEAGLAKAMGQRAGVPDLIVWLPSWGISFFIEMKSSTGGLSTSQSTFVTKIGTFGFSTYVCRSQQDVMAALQSEGVLPGEGRGG